MGDNITMNHKEIGWGEVDWIHLAPDGGQWYALWKTNKPSGSIKARKFLE
jgi:hypothetical protein